MDLWESILASGAGFRPLYFDFRPVGLVLHLCESILGLWESILGFLRQFGFYEVDVAHLVIYFGPTEVDFGPW